jgi:hypothetical protein
MTALCEPWPSSEGHKYHVHIIVPLVPIPIYYFETQFNVILHHMARYSKLLLPTKMLCAYIARRVPCLILAR